MDISNTDMRNLLRAISVLRPHPEQSISKRNAIRFLKLFAKKTASEAHQTNIKTTFKNNRQWQK